MKFSEKLFKNYECKKMTVVRDGTGLFRIFSTMGPDGLLRQTTKCVGLETAMESIGSHDGFEPARINEQAEKESWQIIKTIDFSELGGEGYKDGDWVRVIATGLVETGCVGKIVASKMKDEYQVRLPGLDVSDMQERFFFARHEIEPYFEDEEEEVPTMDLSERLDMIDRKIGIIFEELGITELKCGILSKKKKS